MLAPEAWHDYLHGQFGQAPLSLRANMLKTTRDELVIALAEHGATADPWAPEGVLLPERVALQAHPLFEAGHFEVQDAHSQIVAFLLGAESNHRVLDACAGAGGKSLHLGALMGGRGEIHAYDKAQAKLQKLRERARRAGLTTLRSLEKLPAPEPAFDRVLVDAPCGSLGTLRRNPDRLFRFTKAEADSIRATQAEVLLEASRRVKPGGRLLYVTCSFRPAENIEIVRSFLRTQPQFRPADLRPSLERALGPKLDGFLTKAADSPAARVGDWSPAKLSEGWIQWGPSSQLSGGLVGDAFFAFLVEFS
jgi:16S rRNA (cytosine967-C5)-methyltransferase